MGDESDAFDLPTQGQSGNVDIGHISRDADAEEQRLRGEQSELLTTALNQYYSHDTDFNTLYSNLDEMGYSEDQVDDISAGAHAERVYRMGHEDSDSGLSLNQLAFLQRSTGFQINRTTIRQDLSHEPPMTYVDDFRTRDDEGNPARLYLPQPIQFEPLTADQQSEIRIDERYLSYITLQEPDGTGEMLKDNVDLQTRHQVSQLITNYLSRTSQPGNDQRREQLYRDIQELDGLQSQRNIRPKLVQLFRDIAVEQQYRIMNNGRPQGLTNTQWEQLQNNPNYYGQPILKTDTEPSISYIVSGTNYIEIDDDIEAPRRQREFSETNNQDINLFGTEFLTDNNANDDPQVLTDNILSSIRYDPDDPNDLRIRLQVEDLVNKYNQERIFRSQNNGRPSDISSLQYEFMLNHTLADGEPRYTGEPLTRTTLSDGSIGYGFHSWDTNIPGFIIIPRDNDIRDMIESGFYTRPTPEPEPQPDTNPDQNLRPPIPEGGLPPLPAVPTVIPPVRPISEFLPRPEEPTADPSRTLPPDTPIIATEDLDDQIGPRASGLGDPHDIPPLPAGGLAPTGFEPPIVPGQTQPINLRTGEDLPVNTPESNILRYQQYFNDNQSLYYGFREIFRDILPVLSAGAGGYIGFLYKSSISKNALQTILSEETSLLNELEGRIDELQGDITSDLRVLQRQTERGEELLTDIERIQARTDVIGGRSMQMSILTRKSRELQMISRNIQDQQKLVINLQNEIQDSDIYTLQIKQNIEKLQNQNYEILSEIYSASPQILTGVNVGYTLGLMLSGYLFPTYMNINEPYMTADNIQYDNKDRRSEKTKNLKNPKEEEPTQSIAYKREFDEKPSRIVKPFQETFRPMKHGKRPLKYNEIQELKSTLNQSELNNLKNKYLYFDDNKLKMDKTTDKCKNVIQETQIPKRKVF